MWIGLSLFLLLVAIDLGFVRVGGHGAGGHPSKDFHVFREVKVRLNDLKNDRFTQLDSSSLGNGFHQDGLGLQISEVGGQHEGHDDNVLFDLDLHLNRDLLPQNYFQKYHHKGQSIIERPAINQVDLCHYQGYVRHDQRKRTQKTRTWAAISTCNSTFHGLIHDGQELWHLHSQGSHLYLYQHSAQTDQNFTCGYQDPHSSSSPKKHKHNNVPAKQQLVTRFKRDIAKDNTGGLNNDLLYEVETSNFDNSNHIVVETPPSGVGGNQQKETSFSATPSSNKLRGPWNANKRSRYVELVLVVDHQEYLEHNQDLDLVYRICKDVANVMNALYSPLNIYIALVGVVVWTEYDEIKLSTDGDTTLKNFLNYRKERLVKDHPNDNAQLLTGVQFEGGVVGKALKGPMCTYEFSGGVNMWHSDVVGLVATTVAHEMGHNFGMDHDKEECECPDEKCIMAPASSTMKPTFWSSCSIQYLDLAFEHGMDYCLRNKPEKLFDSPICGNSFVEPGEECDCGLKDHCDNPCCNPETCTLFPNATCATGECCDFATCRPKRPGALCRLAEHECDLPEFCDGHTESCPKDVFKVDGIPCKIGKAFCFEGSCRTHTDQCRLLWGPSGKKSDNQCYEQNKKGTRHGNCGYDRLNDTYVQCRETDVRCGMLHCQHLNERLEFGTESAAILSHSFINSGGRIIPCRTALVDLGLNDVDPGLAPEGARCDEDSLCVNRKCMPVASLTIGPASCKNNCNGHGMCNSKGHCHCDIGYAPPYCDVTGAGGSLDSGPASDVESSSSKWFILLYIVLLLVPIMAVIFLLTQKFRRGEWRLLVEKAKPRKRLSEVDPMAAASVAEAANLANAALPGGGGLKSGASSPTQALLPHVDTSTSALSTVLSEKVQGEAAATTAGSTNNKTSRSASLFANLKKPHFMQNFAKSISLPSPKLRAAVKNMATYEIKVEHQVPKEDISSPSEEMVTESVLAEVKTMRSSKDSVLFIKEEKVNVVATTTTTIVQEQPPLTASMSLTTFGSRPVRSTLPMSSSFRTTASSGKPFVDQPLASDSVTTTTTSGTKQPQLLPSSIAQSKVLEKVKALEATDQNKRPQKEDSDHVIETSASIPAAAILQPLPPTTEYVVASIVSSTSTTVASVVNTQQTSKTQLTTQSSSSSYSQDPKLAFPHSSSFAGRASSAFTTSSAASTATVASVSNRVGSSHSANSLRLATSSAAASKVSSTSATTSSADVVVKQQNIGSNKTDYYSEALKQISAVSSLSSKSSSSKAAPPPPPPKPTSISTKSFVDRSSSIKSSHYNKDDVKSQQHQKASKTTEEANDAPDGGRNSNKVKTPSPTKSSTATTTKALSPVTTTAYSITSSSSTSATMPLLSKTSTLPSPTSSSSASTRKGFGMSKSSTLPIVPSRPVISKPVLQMATPDAASLISKSHSTGVSQSSIIKGDHKISIGGSGTDGGSEASAKETKEAKRTSRGVVFCDPLTLPSPTNPNNPPIIHIQPKPTAPTVTTPPKPTPPPITTTSVTSAPATTSAAVPSSKPIEAKAVIVSSVITPTWSTEAVTSTAVLCHIDDTDSGSEGARSPCKKDSNGAPMASPDESEDVVGGDGHHHQSQPAPPPPSQPQLVKKSKSLSKSLKSKLVKRSQSEKKDRNNSSSSSSKTQEEITIITSSGLSSPTSSVRSSSNDHHPPTTLPLQAQPVKPPQPPRPERGPIRKLDISGPILLHQTNMSTEIKGNFLPVCRAADATPTESTPKISFAQATTASSAASTSSTAAKVDLILKENKDVMVDILLKDNSKVINKVKGNGASPSNTTTARVFEYPAIAATTTTTTTSSSTTSKVISPTGSKDSSPSHKKNKAPQPPPIIPRRQSPSKSAGSGGGGGLASSVKPSDLPVGATAAPGAISSAKKISMKRPASIATTRPSRPSAPPPRPPQQKPNVGGSPTRSDTSSLASVDSSSSTATSKGPSAATSSDESTNNSSQKTSTSNNKKIIPSPLTSPLSLDDFDTPLSSPIIARRSPDALSTASSSDGDLMREILKDLDTEVKDEVSTLMRKKNKNKKKIVD